MTEADTIGAARFMREMLSVVSRGGHVNGEGGVFDSARVVNLEWAVCTAAAFIVFAEQAAPGSFDRQKFITRLGFAPIEMIERYVREFERTGVVIP